MKISQLQYFTTVAQLESISRAAKLLNISQPSLSKNISALEEELGTPLFDRTSNKLSLNEAGRRFLSSCNLMLQEFQSAENDIHLLTTGSDSHIKIGTCGSIDKFYACMAAFKKLHPETEYEVSNSIEDEELPDINQYDVLIYPDEPQYKKFTGYDFGTDSYLLAVPTTHPLARSAALSLKMLHHLDYVFLRKKSHTEYPYKLCTAMTISPLSQSFTDAREIHRQMIASGIAVGFVSESSADFYISKGIRLIPLLDHRFTRDLKICFKRDKHLSDFARTFREFTKDYFTLIKK